MAKLSVFGRPLLIGLILMNSIAIANATVPNSFFVEITISGAQKVKKSRGSERDPYRYDMRMHYDTDTHDTVGGGHAGFGVFDSGQMVLMHYEEYTPSFAEAIFNRGVHTDKHGFGLADTPRYIMVCSWTDEDESGERMFRSYAERDDAGVETRNDKDRHSTLSIRYRPVPTRRAKAKFEDRDYCAEILEMGRSSVPYWLPPGPQR